MIEEKFLTKNGLVIEHKIDPIKDKLAEILGIDKESISILVVKSQVPGTEQMKYSIRAENTSVFIWYDPNGIKVQRKGFCIQVLARDAEKKIYQAIVDIFGDGIY